ncbi:MAG: hypothetical protein KJ767_00700 [Nanoarchaeota archaeon]|nr:hypothetical protein [Nanoarchaeota archaeon]
MKKEDKSKATQRTINIIILGIILVSLSFVMYYFGSPFITGFTIFNTENQNDFDEGTYENTEWDTDHIELIQGNLYGSYTSKIFDAGSVVIWNNISWEKVIIETFDSFLTSAIYNGDNQIKVFTKDESYDIIDMKDDKKRFYLNFTDNLTYNSVLKVYAKKMNGKAIGIYDQTDTNGSAPLGTFTVTSETGDWYNITLNISTPTNSIWFGEGTGSGTDPKEEFDYIYSEVQTKANLTFQTRSDDNNSSWNPFIGPDGTNDTHYIVSSGESLNVSENRYFQYKTYFLTENVIYSPKLYNVTIDYTTFNQPTTTLNSPENNSTWTSSQIVEFKYNVTDTNNISNCSFILNNVATITNSTINKNIIQTFSKTLSNSNYSWSVNCVNSEGEQGNSPTFSLIVDYTPESPSAQKGAGGSSTRSIEIIQNCIENWECTVWSKCLNGKRTRTCTDKNLCKITENTPSIYETCEPETKKIEQGQEQEIMGQQQTGIPITTFLINNVRNALGEYTPLILIIFIILILFLSYLLILYIAKRKKNKQS